MIGYHHRDGRDGADDDNHKTLLPRFTAATALRIMVVNTAARCTIMMVTTVTHPQTSFFSSIPTPEASDIRSHLFAVITFSRNCEYQITIQMVICSHRVEKERKGRRTPLPQDSNQFLVQVSIVTLFHPLVVNVHRVNFKGTRF